MFKNASSNQWHQSILMNGYNGNQWQQSIPRKEENGITNDTKEYLGITITEPKTSKYTYEWLHGLPMIQKNA